MALAGALLATGAFDGADARLTLGLGRASLAFAAPAGPPSALAPLQSVDAAAVPWLRRVGRSAGATATGTLVRWQGRTYLITASHVVNFLPVLAWLPGVARPPLALAGDDGNLNPLPSGRISYWWDLAVYPHADPNALALELAETPEAGDPVTFAGYPLDEAQPWAAVGVVVATTAHPSGGAAAVVAAVEGRQGQSGGALLDAQGRLAGIGVATTPYGVLAVGNGAVAEVLANAEHLPVTPPGAAARLAMWTATVAGALALGLAFAVGLRRAASLLSSQDT